MSANTETGHLINYTRANTFIKDTNDYDNATNDYEC